MPRLLFPTTPATARILSNRSSSAFAEAAIKMTATKTTSEWPSEKKKPVASGFWPVWTSRLTTLSIAAM